LAELLAESGVEIHEASDPDRALESLHAIPIDAVILDISLGAQSGLDLIHEVRAARPAALLVVLTNNASDAHRRECLLRGADFFFDKSREFERAVDVVTRFNAVERAL
jgi:DNA-binding NarL/FixJ family response regulator